MNNSRLKQLSCKKKSPLDSKDHKIDQISIMSFCYVSNQCDIENITGPQYCFNAHLDSFNETVALPLSLFNGKKEGDIITLFLKPNVLEPVTIIYGSIFEQGLYNASCSIYDYNWIPLNQLGHHKLAQRYIAYHGHVDYAKSIHRSARYYWITYEPFLFIDCINIGCNDMNHLLKLLYLDLFEDNIIDL